MNKTTTMTLTVNGVVYNANWQLLPKGNNGAWLWNPTSKGTLVVLGTSQYAGTYTNIPVMYYNNQYWAWPGSQFSVVTTGIASSSGGSGTGTGGGSSPPAGGSGLSLSSIKPIYLFGIGAAVVVITTLVVMREKHRSRRRR